jgi:hypothetical protein
MRELTIKVHSIAEDGLPDMEALAGRVLFIFDGCTVSGWPLHVDPQDYSTPYSGLWEGNTDVSHGGPFLGVTHWIELPITEQSIERGSTPEGRLPVGG